MKKVLIIVLAAILFLACAPQKVYVCKYVGQPGVDERLQAGQNPIEVSVNAIRDFQGVGSWFNDKQGRSFVLGYVGDEVGECPVPDTPPKNRPCVTMYVLTGRLSTCYLIAGEGDNPKELPARFDGTDYMRSLCRWGCDLNPFNWNGGWSTKCIVQLPPCVDCQ